jgi:hypothetical protein
MTDGGALLVSGNRLPGSGTQERHILRASVTMSEMTL